MTFPDAPVNAVIFDLDGVILDSRQQMSVVLEYTLAQHGFPATEGVFTNFFACMGMPLPQIFTRLSLPVALTETYQSLSRSHFHLASVFAGIPELLGDLQQRGIALAVITGKERSRALEVLRYFSLTDYFESVVCGDDPFPGKPHPDGLLWILQQIGIAPAAAVLVGDSPSDILCAKYAGVFPLGAGWGFSSAATLEAAGAVVLPCADDLRNWLRERISCDR